MNIETNGFNPEQSAEKQKDHVLYHVAGFEPNPRSEVIKLEPGTQNAAGKGIYFTEGSPQLKFAGGEKNNLKWEQDHINVFEIGLDHEESKQWFRAKNKPHRPRFWHSKANSLLFKNQYKEQEIDGHLCHIYSDLIEDETIQ